MKGYHINEAKDLLGGYSFTVFFENEKGDYFEVGFSKMSSVSAESEYEIISEGSGQMHIVPKYNSNPSKLTFEKGVYSLSASVKPLESTYLAVGSRIHLITVEVFSKNFEISGYYEIKNAVVTRWEVSGFDALGSSALINSFEISYAPEDFKVVS